MRISFQPLTLTVYYQTQFERTWIGAGARDTERIRSRWFKRHMIEAAKVERAITRAREHGIKEG